MQINNKIHKHTKLCLKLMQNGLNYCNANIFCLFSQTSPLKRWRSDDWQSVKQTSAAAWPSQLWDTQLNKNMVMILLNLPCCREDYSKWHFKYIIIKVPSPKYLKSSLWTLCPWVWYNGCRRYGFYFIINQSCPPPPHPRLSSTHKL